jgi:hypothetical protein
VADTQSLIVYLKVMILLSSHLTHHLKRHVCIAQHSFATFLLQQLIATSAHATMVAVMSPRHLDASH